MQAVTDEYRGSLQLQCRHGLNRRAENIARAKRRQRGPEREAAIREFHESDPEECLLLYEVFGQSGGYTPRNPIPRGAFQAQEDSQGGFRTEEHGFG